METATDGVWAIVVAGGSGTRFGRPKQFASLGSVDGARRVGRRRGVGRDGRRGGRTERRPARDRGRRRRGRRAGRPGPARSAPGWPRCPPTPRSSWCTTRHARSPRHELFDRVVAEVRAGAVAVTPAVAVVDSLRELERRAGRSGSPGRGADATGLPAHGAPGRPRGGRRGHRRRRRSSRPPVRRGGRGPGRAMEPQDHRARRPAGRRGPARSRSERS